MAKPEKKVSIEYSDKFRFKFSEGEISKLLGTELDNTHYYFAHMLNMSMVENSKKGDSQPKESNLLVGRFKVDREIYEIYLNGESKITSFGNILSFDEKENGDKESFHKILEMINKNQCLEESVPYFTVHAKNGEEGFIKSNEIVATSLIEVLNFANSL